MVYKRSWGDITNRLKEEAQGNGGANADKRMYKPKFAADGTFEAVVRFLPAPGDEVPMVKKFMHSFKDKGGDYREECPTTIGQPCPVCEANTEKWKTASEDEKKNVLRPRSRQTSGISNILVISDPQVPANNGKVFLYRYGKIIFEKITDKCFPDDKKRSTGVNPVNVFDYFEGAAFRVSAIKKSIGGGQMIPKYDNSSFDTPTPIGDDAFIETIEPQLYSLKEFIEVGKFKPYNQLRTLFDKVRGIAVTPPPASAAAPQPTPVVEQAPQVQQTAPASSPIAAAPATPAPTSAPVAAPAPIVNAAPVSAPTNPALDFNSMENQSEDDFWGAIKRQ